MFFAQYKLIIMLSLTALSIGSLAVWGLKELGSEREKRKQLSLQLSQLRYSNVLHEREIEAQAIKARNLARKLHKIKGRVSRHDISKLLGEKPKKVLTAVNNGTRKLVGLLECASDITCDMQAVAAPAGDKFK